MFVTGSNFLNEQLDDSQLNEMLLTVEEKTESNWEISAPSVGAGAA